MRITGTHIYSLLHCAHAVALDLHEDRSKRREITELEEFVRRRGRDWEAEFVADLDYQEPSFERGDFAGGAAQTLAFLREGVSGVTQAVLLEEPRLGIPDLLRREDGESELGSFHYVVGDIKSSGRPRSDQLLQVAFYSRMLARLQGRDPDYGYLILKTGVEERFCLADYDAAIEEVEERVLQLAADPAVSQPFFNRGCHKCHWSQRCVPGLREADDLSLLQGMTRGVRTTLQQRGFTTCASLQSMLVDSESQATHLEPALLRRIKQSALARAAGRPIRQVAAPLEELADAAVIHHLYDAFSERLLWVGVLHPAGSTGQVFDQCPTGAVDELACFEQVIARLPRRALILHYGEALPRWYANAVVVEGDRPPGIDRVVGSDSAGIAVATEARFVDLARRARGVAIYQGPVFGSAQHIEYLLGLDPHREGEADAAALWADRPEGEAWLRNKGRSDLADLSALVQALLETGPSGFAAAGGGC